MRSMTIEVDVCSSTGVRLCTQSHDEFLGTSSFGNPHTTVDDGPWMATSTAMLCNALAGHSRVESASKFCGRNVDLAIATLASPAPHPEAW